MIVVTKVQQVSPILLRQRTGQTVSYDKQSVLEGTREFHLVTFIMLVRFMFATLIIWYVGGPVLRCCSYLNKPPTYD